MKWKKFNSDYHETTGSDFMHVGTVKCSVCHEDGYWDAVVSLFWRNDSIELGSDTFADSREAKAYCKRVLESLAKSCNEIIRS